MQTIGPYADRHGRRSTQRAHLLQQVVWWVVETVSWYLLTRETVSVLLRGTLPRGPESYSFSPFCCKYRAATQASGLKSTTYRSRRDVFPISKQENSRQTLLHKYINTKYESRLNLCLARNATPSAHMFGACRGGVARPHHTVPCMAAPRLTSSGPHKGTTPAFSCCLFSSHPPPIARRSLLTAPCRARIIPLAAPFSPATATQEPMATGEALNCPPLVVAAWPPVPRCRSPNVTAGSKDEASSS